MTTVGRLMDEGGIDSIRELHCRVIDAGDRVSANSVHSWVSGRRKPQPAHREFLARALGVSVAVLNRALAGGSHQEENNGGACACGNPRPQPTVGVEAVPEMQGTDVDDVLPQDMRQVRVGEREAAANHKEDEL